MPLPSPAPIRRPRPGFIGVLLATALTLPLGAEDAVPPVRSATAAGTVEATAPAASATAPTTAVEPAAVEPAASATAAEPAAVEPAASATAAVPKPPPWKGAWQTIGESLAPAGWAEGGIGAMTVAPDGAVVVAIAGAGLWMSTDRGTTWARRDAAAGAAPLRPAAIAIDPVAPSTWWIASLKGPGLWHTADAGATLRKVGMLLDIGGVAVLPAEGGPVLLATQRRQRGLQRSENGGTTWRKAGEGLPEEVEALAQPHLIDAQTWLVVTAEPAPGAAKKPKKKRKDAPALDDDGPPPGQGIWRTGDGGKTWERVFSRWSREAPLAIDRDTLLWAFGAREGIARSKDRGRTWTPIQGAVRSAPMALAARAGAPSWLAALGETGILLSSDGGRSWMPIGPDLPFMADGLAYDATAPCFYAWRSTPAAAADAIARLDVPADLATVVTPSIKRTAMLWDGDEATPVLDGWVSPKHPPNAIGPTREVARVGGVSLRYVVKNESWANAGCSWGKPTAQAVAGAKAVAFAIKVDGPVAPTALSIQFGAYEDRVDLVKRCPDVLDGGWHEIVIPLPEAIPGGDPAAITGMRLNANGVTIDAMIHVDDIGFTEALSVP